MLRDALTGLPNRIAFSERLDGPEADGQAMLETAILVADLDRFSRINDSLGHLAGDELLATIARRLLSAMREGDVLARIGGDEFGVIVRMTDGPGDALNVASLIQEEPPHPLRVKLGRAARGESRGHYG